ncbi:unnamed protein product [Phytomonas sp. EM1]|nr:unnamed protein product [Phytomonas sp. EM1]|eukprot:CCW59900.1 unnamed protein product [Phytomonas sp. isolate EM1]
MALSPKDKKAVRALVSALEKMDDFKDTKEEAEKYAEAVVLAVKRQASDAEEFKDQIMGIIANVNNLNSQIVEQKISPEALASMEIDEMLSKKQIEENLKASRKRAREQTLYDITSMQCEKCGLVRRDRLNINELGLDSEINGSQFDYNFDNLCDCSQDSQVPEDAEKGEEEDAES